MNQAMKSSKYFSIIVVAAMLSIATASAGENKTPKSKSAVADVKTYPRKKTYMKRKWGIEVLWVRTTAAAYMLEFRYKVLDADKAKPLFKRKSKPILIHEKSGSRMIVPTPGKVGALRNSNKPKEGKTYWMFFANPAKYVKQGDLVSIQIGDYLQQHLVVQ